MKKTQLLVLSLMMMPQAFADSLMVLPCNQAICTDYLKVDSCRLERCTFHLHGLKPIDKYFLIGEALLPTQKHEGREWLKSAAALGSVEAMFLLAQDDEQSGNMSSAWYWYEQAAYNGHMLAQARLGDRYFYGQGTSVNIPDAIHWYSEAGNQGYLPAQVRLGDIYFDGIYCEQNFTQAAYWYHLGALQGDAHSAYQYGAMLSAGNGVAHDEKEAIKWLTVAAEQDVVEAQSLLGRIYYQQRQFAQALCWLKKASTKGDVAAITTLGRMYRYGHGVVQDFRQSAVYYRRAAESGHTQAQAILGLYYNQGLGLPKNYVLAARWYEQAAMKGNALAQFNLSTLYFNGKGVECDYIHAYAWASIAADNDLHSAIEARRLLSNQMTGAQIQRAQLLASQLVR